MDDRGTEGAVPVDTVENIGKANGDTAERRYYSPSLLRATEDKVIKKRDVL